MELGPEEDTPLPVELGSWLDCDAEAGLEDVTTPEDNAEVLAGTLELDEAADGGELLDTED